MILICIYIYICFLHIIVKSALSGTYGQRKAGYNYKKVKQSSIQNYCLYHRQWAADSFGIWKLLQETELWIPLFYQLKENLIMC